MYPATSYGSFADDGRSYRITDPYPPRQLCNVLQTDEAYYGEISHYGTGSAFQQAPDGQINTVVTGQQKTLYCRDEDSGDVWCPGVYPMMSQVEEFSCEHHDAYTVISSVRNGIRVTWRIFMPLSGAREIWTVTVRNERPEPARISLVPAARLQCDGFKAPRFYDEQTIFATSDFDEQLNGLIMRADNPNTPWKRRHVALAASREVADFSADEAGFLGAPAAMHYPAALLDGNELGRKDCYHGPLFVAIRCELEVAPNSEQRCDFLFALVESADEARQLARDIADAEAVEAIARQTEQTLRERRDRLTIRTPDPQIDAFVNLWIKKGLEYCLNKKDATRDNLQFSDGLVMSRPDLARAELLKVLRYQYAEGWAVRSWVPMDATRYGDCHLWIPLVVCGYVKFTDDVAFLDEVVPFIDEGEGTVLEHMTRAVACTDADRGPHGLPRSRYADWNDSLNLQDEDSESVYCAMHFGCVLKEMEALMRYLDRPDEAERYAAMHSALAETVNRVAWDETGGYYVRAFADGKVFGAPDSAGSKVFINPQSWAILGRMVPEERLPRVLKAIDELLETDMGSAVNLPGYDEYDPRMGRISAQLPGAGENGGVYCHATGFKAAADTLVGRGDEALRSVRKLLPDSEWNPAERSGATPFAMTSRYALHPLIYGQAGRAWLTGTQSWVMRTVVEGLLGVRRAYGGFLLAPALPSGWDKAEVSLVRNGDSYRIRIERTGQAAGPTVTLNGRQLETNFVPFQADGVHEIIVAV